MESDAGVNESRGFHRAMMEVGHFVGLTLLLGLGGGLSVVFGYRKLAGVLWTSLGAGSAGVAFAGSTRGTLRLDELHPLTEVETAFLVSHLPFLLLGVLLLLTEGRD